MNFVHHKSSSTSPRLSGKVDDSRLDGCATATLREHKRRASAQDYVGSIRVRMAGETARGADEASLILAASAVHGSALNGNVPNPIDLTPELGDLAPLVSKIERPSATSKDAALLQGEIVNEARHADDLLEPISLFGGRVKAIAEGPLNHRLFLSQKVAA